MKCISTVSRLFLVVLSALSISAASPGSSGSDESIQDLAHQQYLKHDCPTILQKQADAPQDYIKSDCSPKLYDAGLCNPTLSETTLSTFLESGSEATLAELLEILAEAASSANRMSEASVVELIARIRAAT